MIIIIMAPYIERGKERKHVVNEQDDYDNIRLLFLTDLYIQEWGISVSIPDFILLM